MSSRLVFSIPAVLLLTGCMVKQPAGPFIKPSLEYARKVGGGHVEGFDPPQIQHGAFRSSAEGGHPQAYAAGYQGRAQLRMAKDLPPDARNPYQQERRSATDETAFNVVPDVEVYRSQRPNALEYTGPLQLGDPGVSASLWRASRRGNNLFQDDRAWQPYDLITVVVSERAEGIKQADTEVKTTSNVLAAITSFLGYETALADKNPNLDIGNLINATTATNYKGEGDTVRRGSLTARLSAMVVEVLPGGILRIEGEKIIAVNSEEEVMVISGLVRPRDINSLNEVNSSNVAQLRVDFYGEGTVSSAQRGGWLGNLFRSFWPF
jgi:flagellar L-ring protein FlgH